MEPIKVGIIGFGFSAKCFHLPYIMSNPDLQLHAFLQRAEAPADKAKVESGKHCTVDYPDVKHYRKADDFFADRDTDLVIVTSHHDTHAEFAEKALLAGKHVVVEKAFTRTAAEADHLINVQKKTGKILTCYQNRRYDSDFRTIHQLTTQNAFGQITECEIHYDVDFPPWMQGWTSPSYTPGDGMMYGLGSHTIDQALVLFGTPARITAWHRSLRGIKSETDDSFTMVLEYDRPENLMVTIKTSAVTPMEQPLKYFVRGYDGSFLKYGEDVQESQIMAGGKALDEGYGCEPEGIYGLLVTKERMHEAQVREKKTGRYVGKYPSLKGSYLDYYGDLVKAIRGEGELVVRPKQSRDVIRVIELGRESARLRKTVDFN